MTKTATLIQGCIYGHRYAQSQLYELFSPRMPAVCLLYSKNKEEADEILQGGFIKVFRFLHQFNFEGSFDGRIRKATSFLPSFNFALTSGTKDARVKSYPNTISFGADLRYKL